MALAPVPSRSGDLAWVDVGEVSTTRHGLVHQLLCACVTKEMRDACKGEEWVGGWGADVQLERGNKTVVTSNGGRRRGIRLARNGLKQLMKGNRFCGGVVAARLMQPTESAQMAQLLRKLGKQCEPMACHPSRPQHLGSARWRKRGETMRKRPTPPPDLQPKHSHDPPTLRLGSVPAQRLG